MGQPAALACIRCGESYPVTAWAEDCARCRATAPAGLTVRYATDPPALRRGPTEAPSRAPSPRSASGSPAAPGGAAGDARWATAPETPSPLWRWAEGLPVDAHDAVSLGEGGTPLLPLPRLAGALGVAALWVKDESRNPTWSFKDRLATVAVSTARRLGARVIASSSSGNAGAAVAAYAARAGLPCVVFTFTGAAGPMVTQMRAHGAMVLAVRDKADRWKLLEAGVRGRGWFPTSPFFAPAVGSNPYGIEGYKTLAYEVAEALGWRAPDWCVLPVCYGDALYGMWKGFDELARLGWIDAVPRLAAAEVYGSLGAALASGADAVPDMPKTRESLAASIGATRSTYQALHALRASGGAARTVGDDELLEFQARLASEGVYAEASSVAPLAAVRRLRRDGVMGAEASVVVVATAGGLKDPAATERRLPGVPVVPASLEAACDALRETYGFDAG
jgi:threonine synthase